jgi:hypothetical protein
MSLRGERPFELLLREAMDEDVVEALEEEEVEEVVVC